MSFLESKLPVWAETWDLDQFEYVEFNGGVHFVCVCVCVCVCFFFRNYFPANFIQQIKIVSLS